MESVVFEDSPLAAYLEGAGEADDAFNSMPLSSVPPLSPPPADHHHHHSFAPQGKPKGFSRLRRKLPGALKLEVPETGSAVVRLQRRCADILQAKLPGSRNADFLDRFHYILIASQLLNDHACLQGYNPRLSLQNATTAAAADLHDVHRPSYTTRGVLATAAAAFVVAWLIHWGRNIAQSLSATWRLSFVILILACSGVSVYFFLKRQWLLYFRRQAIEAASSLVANAQAFDAASAATVSLIQEVELVSRGYRISSPLPPVSRLEEQSQSRRCAKLRRVLRESLDSSLLSYAESYTSLKGFAVELDLERYAEIYEVSRSDIDEVQAFASGGKEEFSDAESLKSLKVSLQRLHTIRKLCLCCLLAIRSDGTKQSLSHWTQAVDSMRNLSASSASAAASLDSILSEDTRYSSLPQTPSKPSSLTPAQERLRAQLRKFASLSAGTRELQAKIYLLREESDNALNDPASSDDTVTEIGAKLLDQYDAFGADLKNLVREWESGRAALTAQIDRNERRQSLSSSNSTGLMSLPPFSPSSRSTTPSSSLSGATALGSGGSPADALKILNGETPHPFSPIDLLNNNNSSSDNEEVFEAVALPPQRSRGGNLAAMSRDERITKMKEERVRLAAARERADAGRNMMRELETVIKFRPALGGVGEERTPLRARVISL